jgi:hypothetical protein
MSKLPLVPDLAYSPMIKIRIVFKLQPDYMESHPRK